MDIVKTTDLGVVTVVSRHFCQATATDVAHVSYVRLTHFRCVLVVSGSNSIFGAGNFFNVGHGVLTSVERVRDSIFATYGSFFSVSVSGSHVNGFQVNYNLVPDGGSYNVVFA